VVSQRFGCPLRCAYALAEGGYAAMATPRDGAASGAVALMPATQAKVGGGLRLYFLSLLCLF
jgi:hypothetical protein